MRSAARVCDFTSLHSFRMPRLIFCRCSAYSCGYLIGGSNGVFGRNEFTAGRRRAADETAVRHSRRDDRARKQSRLYRHRSRPKAWSQARATWPCTCIVGRWSLTARECRAPEATNDVSEGPRGNFQSSEDSVGQAKGRCEVAFAQFVRRWLRRFTPSWCLPTSPPHSICWRS